MNNLKSAVKYNKMESRFKPCPRCGNNLFDQWICSNTEHNMIYCYRTNLKIVYGYTICKACADYFCISTSKLTCLKCIYSDALDKKTICSFCSKIKMINYQIDKSSKLKVISNCVRCRPVINQVLTNFPKVIKTLILQY